MADSRSHVFRRKYPSTLESEAAMFEDLQCFLEKHGLGGRMAHVLRLCVSEAFTNALEHGNEFSSEKQVSISLAVNETSVSADIQDEGSGGLAKIARRKKAKSHDEGGRGVDLIYRHAGETTVSETESGGLRVFMSFLRSAFEKEETINQ